MQGIRQAQQQGRELRSRAGARSLGSAPTLHQAEHRQIAACQSRCNAFQAFETGLRLRQQLHRPAGNTTCQKIKPLAERAAPAAAAARRTEGPDHAVQGGFGVVNVVKGLEQGVEELENLYFKIRVPLGRPSPMARGVATVKGSMLRS